MSEYWQQEAVYVEGETKVSFIADIRKKSESCSYPSFTLLGVFVEHSPLPGLVLEGKVELEPADEGADEDDRFLGSHCESNKTESAQSESSHGFGLTNTHCSFRDRYGVQR
jgi:hypothetical protein